MELKEQIKFIKALMALKQRHLRFYLSSGPNGKSDIQLRTSNVVWFLRMIKTVLKNKIKDLCTYTISVTTNNREFEITKAFTGIDIIDDWSEMFAQAIIELKERVDFEEQEAKIIVDPEDTMIEIINRTQNRILRVISLTDIITEHLWFSDRMFLSQQITADIFLDGFNGTPDIKAFFRKYL